MSTPGRTRRKRQSDPEAAPGQSRIVRLVRASQGGDTAAYDRLVRLHLSEAMYAALGILGNRLTAAEVVCKAFHRGYLQISRLVFPGRFRFWILGLVLDEAIVRRKPARRRAVLGKFLVLAGWRRNVVGPGSRGSDGSPQEAVERAMVQLRADEARTIALHRLDGFSDEDVAWVMGCSVRKVQWCLHRARLKLRLWLAAYLEPGNESLDRLLRQVRDRQLADWDWDRLGRSVSTRLSGFSRSGTGGVSTC